MLVEIMKVLQEL